MKSLVGHPPSLAASLQVYPSHSTSMVTRGESSLLGCILPKTYIPSQNLHPTRPLWFPREHPLFLALWASPSRGVPHGSQESCILLTSPSHGVPTHLMNFSKSAAVSGGSYRVTTLWLRRRLSKTSLWRLSSSWCVWNTLGSSEVAERTRSTESLPLPFCSSSCSRCSSVSEWLMVAAVESPLKSPFWAAGRWDHPRAAPQCQALR